MSREIHPACAGINLSLFDLVCNFNSPRIRGDQPRVTVMVASFFAFIPHARGSPPQMVVRFKENTFTPRARGSTRENEKWQTNRFIYPACAGINRGERQEHRKHQHLPRMRGINLCRSSAMVLFSNLPRVRGDQPVLHKGTIELVKFTPRALGSTMMLSQREC